MGVLACDMKKLNCISVLLFLLLSGFVSFQMDGEAFYKALSSGSENTLDSALADLEKRKQSSQNSAYQGALLMKKAGFVKGVKEKVKTFKAGAKLLEAEIDKNPGNVEYKFLRLTIQEHAPKVLHYDKQLKSDKAAIINGYEKLDATLKTVIADYAQSSKVLKVPDLKGK